MTTPLNSLHSFIKDAGIIWDPSGGGISGHYTYGPLGCRLKKQIELYLAKYWETLELPLEQIETPLIFSKDVWKSSGHWDKFHDMIILTKSGKQFRLDHQLEKHFPDLDINNFSEDDLLKLLPSLPPPDGELWDIPDKILYKSLMMKTESAGKECGLRPETATATYYAFPELLNYFHKIYPMGVFQIGKAFRNEISARQNVIRSREFTQAEAQVFIQSKQKNEYFNDLLIPHYDDKLSIYISSEDLIKTITIKEALASNLTYSSAYLWLLNSTYQFFLSLFPISMRQDQKNIIRLRQHTELEKAFYALDAWDIEIKLNNYGWTEIAGIHDRGDYDLTQYCKNSNTKFKFTKKKGVPHILEVAIGIDRLLYSLLDIYYQPKDKLEGKSIISLPFKICPTQVSILPLVKNNPNIVKLSHLIYKKLKPHFRCEYNDKGSIGKRYLINAKKAIPWSITIDYESIDSISNSDTGTVTVRNRDTEKQERILISDLITYLQKITTY